MKAKGVTGEWGREPKGVGERKIIAHSFFYKGKIEWSEAKIRVAKQASIVVQV